MQILFAVRQSYEHMIPTKFSQVRVLGIPIDSSEKKTKVANNSGRLQADEE